MDVDRQISATSSSTGFLSSPRMQQRLVWISGAVLLIGVAVFLGVFLSRGTSRPAPASNLSTVSSGPPSSKPAKNQKVAASAAAFQVARTFLETAVLRKNLDAAYPLVGPNLKGGMSLAQWRKGNIAVVPYPALNAKTARFKVKSSHKNELMLQVGPLVARKGSGVRPLAFDLNVDRIGGKWVVNYWLADYSIPVRANPNN